MLTGFRVSRENRTPPDWLRCTRKAFWAPVDIAETLELPMYKHRHIKYVDIVSPH